MISNYKRIEEHQLKKLPKKKKKVKYNKRKRKFKKKHKNINSIINSMIICRSNNKCSINEYTIYDIEPSEAEKLTIKKLKFHNLNFDREVAFDDFITSTGSHRRFDFYIPKINLIIEYDGKHHEEDEYAKYVDNLKNEFCKMNNLNLIRVNRNNFRYLFKAIKRIKK